MSPYDKQLMLQKQWAETVGVDMKKLDVGILLEIETRMTTYCMTKLQNGSFVVRGGQFEDETKIIYLGAEWPDERHVKKDWLGQGMQMVLLQHKTKILTDPVTSARMVVKGTVLEVWDE